MFEGIRRPKEHAFITEIDGKIQFGKDLKNSLIFHSMGGRLKFETCAELKGLFML